MDPDLAKKERRYSPAVCTSVRNAQAIGNPNMGTVSDSIVERMDPKRDRARPETC